MKVYKGFTASPGLVLGQVSRLDRPPLVFGEGPFHPEQEKQALEDAIKVAQQELDEMGIPTEFHHYPGLRHGFGLGTGTVAEGWIDEAAAFWQRQVED